MNKQELFKQADYTFQRGNRTLAKKYLTDFLATYPNDIPAWMLLAKVVETKEHKIECYERVLKISPNYSEARIGLARIKSANPTLPRKENTAPWQVKQNPYKNTFRAGLVVLVIFLLFGTTTFVIARNNPNSQLAKFMLLATPISYDPSALSGDIAPQTRAEVNENYPQYAPLVDALIGYAVASADNGMEGAPERPGSEIMFSEQSSMEAQQIIENALPQAGSLTSITITEQQITSWLAMEMQGNPDLPLSDVQVYLRNGQVQVWGMVNGSADSTSGLIVGEINIDNNQLPYLEIESMQIGTQVIPDFLVGQMEAWINETVAESISEQLPGLTLMNINVVNGLITLSGMR